MTHRPLRLIPGRLVALLVSAAATACGPSDDGGPTTDQEETGHDHAGHADHGTPSPHAGHQIADPTQRPFEPEGGPRSTKHAELLEIARRLDRGDDNMAYRLGFTIER